MPRYVYGDSFGGLQAAEQTYDAQRDARYFNTLADSRARAAMAAQERAQAAQLEDAANTRALSLWLASQDRALAQANRDREFDYTLGLSRQDAADRAANRAFEERKFQSSEQYGKDALALDREKMLAITGEKQSAIDARDQDLAFKAAELAAERGDLSVEDIGRTLDFGPVRNQILKDTVIQTQRLLGDKWNKSKMFAEAKNRAQALESWATAPGIGQAEAKAMMDEASRLKQYVTTTEGNKRNVIDVTLDPSTGAYVPVGSPPKSFAPPPPTPQLPPVDDQDMVRLRNYLHGMSLRSRGGRFAPPVPTLAPPPEPQQMQPVRVQTVEEAFKLPANTLFIDPNTGAVRRRS